MRPGLWNWRLRELWNLRQFYVMYKSGVVAMEMSNKYGREIKVLEFRWLQRIISHGSRMVRIEVEKILDQILIYLFSKYVLSTHVSETLDSFSFDYQTGVPSVYKPSRLMFACVASKS